MHPGVTAVVAVASASAGSAGFLAGLAAVRPRFRRLAAETMRARWLAEHDTLTGLPNRAAARHRFQHDAAAGRTGAVALLDLDGFKVVNDTWGHQVGDAHLAAVADRLGTAGRGLGTRVFRLGGDEFVLLLPGLDPHEALTQIAAIIAALGAELPLVIDETRTVVTRPSASVGLAIPVPGDSFSDVLRHADIALYHAKRQRSGPRLYTPELRLPATQRHQGEELLEAC